MDEVRNQLDRVVWAGTKKESGELISLENVLWPPMVARVQMLVKEPTKLRDVLKAAARAGNLGAGDVLRGLEILTTAGIVSWTD
jgi:hypothetical protein